MDVYKKYNIKKVINASGKMTILGGSRVHQDTLDYCHIGAKNFFEVSDLLEKTGEYIANLLDVESAYVVQSASSGIAQAIGAAICQDDYHKIMNIYDSHNQKRDVVICKGHNVNYGTAIEVTMRLGGAQVVEAGYANQCTKLDIESCISDDTVALLYVKSHHCVQKNMPDIETFIALGQKYCLPVIVDAAAEEDLKKYYRMGADCVVYSGTKALGGPTSGLIIGKKHYIDLIKKQYQGIGRVMKVGKESILGLTYAVEAYLKKPPLTLLQQENFLQEFHVLINKIPGIYATCQQDSAGRDIIRSEITFEKGDAKYVSQKLKTGDIHIYTRDYQANQGKLEIDIRDLTTDELMIIYHRIKDIMEESYGKETKLFEQ